MSTSVAQWLFSFFNNQCFTRVLYLVDRVRCANGSPLSQWTWDLNWARCLTLSCYLTSLDLNGSKMATVMSRACLHIMREYFIVSVMFFNLLAEEANLHEYTFSPTVFLF